MKLTVIFLIIGFVFVGCKKDKVTPVISSSYYQSDGNFLILVLGDTLESVYEYNLPPVQLSNDSLQINYESVPGETGLYNYQYWKIQPNNDTLFWTYSNTFTFMEEQVSSKSLLSLNSSLSFNLNQFQVIGSSLNVNIEDLWSNVSLLDIVKEYRESSPNSKIGISRQVVYIYDDQLNFNVPHLKHLIFVAK
ncbi:MAG: hypothetical protein HRT58_22525 [Crocinitomicaceae bacterium]|nr:hypothetical protein [Flavobacteriales bacterium]NQZ38454.1 hypothetical protein [Crocinitomicaceae bacterium]